MLLQMLMSFLSFMAAHPEVSLPLLGAVATHVLRLLGSKWPNVVGAVAAILPDVERFAYHVAAMRKRGEFDKPQLKVVPKDESK